MAATQIPEERTVPDMTFQLRGLQVSELPSTASNGLSISRPHRCNPGTGRLAASTISFLSLPFEIRRSIFQYVFQAPEAAEFPPPKPTKTATSRRDYVSPLLICRQVHGEMHLLPFQINKVKCPSVFGSNITATKQFLSSLREVQRGAIRQIDLSLLASVTEIWEVRSLLRLMAGMDETDRRQNTARQDTETRPSRDASSGSRFDLRSLTIHIGTRDLYLQQADSLAGLMHFLACGPPYPVSFASTSWVTEGLVHVRALRRLTIIVEASGDVAHQVSSTERDQFQQTLAKQLPGDVTVNVAWRIKNPIWIIDDSEWADFSWPQDPSYMQAERAVELQGSTPGDLSVGFSYSTRTPI
ncbi:hypothetical protein PV05_09685 [Exophiala xenobiotica]|uniref:F-box domain-containing protein n=1 Tax=Exophiala xenobiotica TaxID=348802 RepID=A0A0D2E635_9EURO|nr:uncharacterized protein PV05_09685 [Exophiala xenobiotica]KIW50908.1 hypothetical protein PV05_09685 [Exophiala xenobiotica]